MTFNDFITELEILLRKYNVCLDTGYDGAYLMNLEIEDDPVWGAIHNASELET
jgi:hypothetical protein